MKPLRNIWKFEQLIQLVCDFFRDIAVHFLHIAIILQRAAGNIQRHIRAVQHTGVYETVAEYLEKNKEKHENKLFFVSDENQQAQYIRLFQEQGLEAAILSAPVDKPFVSFLEYKNPGVKVQRIDADISETLQEKNGDASNQTRYQPAPAVQYERLVRLRPREHRLDAGYEKE